MKKNLEKPSCSCNSIKHEVKSETRTGISLKKMLGGLNGLLLIYLISIIIPSQDVFSQVTYDNNQKWKWLHPKPQGGYLLWCKMWDKNTWYFAGQNGLFMKTTNGGSNWSISYNASRIISVISLQKGDIRSAHFFNQNTGILVGSFGSVFKTTNAGTTFDSIPGIFINTYTWYKVFFLNQNTGYIAGANDNLVKTTNGGSNWNFITSIPTAPNFDIWTPNDTLIIISSSGGNIKRSTNGGVNWATINTGSSSELYRLCFVNTDTGFVSGTSGAVRMTTNGGFSWISVNGGLPVSKYYDLDYRTTGPNREIYLTGNGQYIYKTTNYGSSWDTVGIWGANQSFLIQYQAYYCTDLGNSDTLLTVGDGLINKRNSAGERICYLDFLKYGYNNISDIWVSGNKIWAVGTYTVTTPHQNDQIIYSSDKGNTWVKQNITGGSTGKFTRISMINDNTGFTAGTEGKIRKTINGGNTWDSLISPTTTLLRKIEFVNSNTGWVFGDAGTIYKSTDGGLSWSQQTAAGVNSIIFGADMIDENTGWIVGRDAKVSKTTNGGSSWTAQNPNTYLMFDLFSIKMLDANTGYLGGVRTFRKTTDGGTTWDSVPQPFPTNGTFFQITGMDFINPQVGMINILRYPNNHIMQ